MSPRYRQYLTPDQFAEQFAPTEQDYQALVAFCEKAEGLTITNRHTNSGVLDVAGTTSSIQNVFHISLTIRRRPDDSTFYAPDREPSLDLDVPVLHISGLDDFIKPVAHVGSAPNGEFGGSDFRNAYAPGVTLTGQGQTVGLYAQDGFYTADINAYKAKFNLEVPVQVVTLNGYSQTPSQSGPKGVPNGNQIETALDIEMAMAMAPGLQSVVVYEGSNQDSILAAMASPPPGIPLSYQLSASYTFQITAKSKQLVTQMAAQGQTLFVIAGDGRALCPGEGGDSRSLDNVTVVGGTYLVMNGSGSSWESETAGSNGGGVETGVPIPSYQKGLATTANGGSNRLRNIPDVALVASNVFTIANNGQQLAVGGTSVAAPLWAGYIALVNEQRQLDGVNPVGFINPTIYRICRLPWAYARDFHDIQSGGSNLIPPPCTGYIGYNATVGYDLASGLGTPTANLIGDLAFPPWQSHVVEV
jgi:subtilase family serine protease